MIFILIIILFLRKIIFNFKFFKLYDFINILYLKYLYQVLFLIFL